MLRINTAFYRTAVINRPRDRAVKHANTVGSGTDQTTVINTAHDRAGAR